MKTKEEIEELAEIAFQKELKDSNQNINWVGYGKGIRETVKETWKGLWIKGYLQSQLDKEKDIIKAKMSVYKRYADWNDEVADDANQCIERLKEQLSKLKS